MPPAVSSNPPRSAGPDEKPPILSPRVVPRWPALLAWLVIAGCVTFILYRNAHSVRLQADAVMVNAMQLKHTAQLLIRDKARAARPNDALFNSMEKHAKTPVDRLHIAIITAEIRTTPADALAQLDTLEQAAADPELAADIAALRIIYTKGPAALTAAAQARLIERHDYFARVALAYGVPADLEPRKSIEASARRAAIIAGVIVLGLLLLLAVSLVVFVQAVVFVVKGKIRPAYLPDALANTAFLEGFALYLALYIGFGLLARLTGTASMVWYLPALLIIPLVMLWLAWRGVGSGERRQALGWHCGRGWQREIGAGLVGFIAGVPLEALGIFISISLAQLTQVNPMPNPVEELITGNAWKLVALYVLVCGFAPVMEETMFRGALFHHLRRRWGWLGSASVVAVIFAIIHPYGWVAVPALGSTALVLAALREWRGSIIAPMVAHACHNFIATTALLLLLR